MTSIAAADSAIDASEMSKNLARSRALVLPFPSLKLRIAVASIALNISEGNGRTSLKDRARFFGIARASAAESAACIDVALALRLVSESDALSIKDLLLQIVKMLYKLR